MKYSKIIVGIVIALNVLFTIGVLLVYLKTGSEPTTLIGCWFGFTTGELWLTASIKKKETENENKQNNNYKGE